jgi:hypothetical protein
MDKMDINSLAATIFNVQTIYLCLAIYVVTYLVRMLFEGTWGILVQQGEIKKGSVWGRIWGEVLVPILPIIIGGLLSFAAKTFVWPDFAVKTKLARVLYGCICGLFSAFIYNRIRGWLKSGHGRDDDDGITAEPIGLAAPTHVEIKTKNSEPPKPTAA